MTNYNKTIESKSHSNASFIIFVGKNSWQPSSFSRIQQQKQDIVALD